MRVRAPDGHVRVRHDSCWVRGGLARGRHGVDERRAASATQEGRFKEQILPVDVPGAGRVEIDEGIRTDTSMEKLAKLPPVFREGGQVTAGNASQLSDGAAAMVVMSEKAADRHGV